MKEEEEEEEEEEKGNLIESGPPTWLDDLRGAIPFIIVVVLPKTGEMEWMSTSICIKL